MLRNWPIRTKLVIILVVPLTALAALSAFAVRDNVENVRASDRIRTLADFAIITDDLVHTLQRERYVAATQFGIPQQDGGQVAAARSDVDSQVAKYLEGEAALPESTRDSVAETLATSAARLGGLADQRKRYDDPKSGIRRDEIITYYSSLIGELLRLHTQIGAGSRDTDLVARASTLASFSAAKEAFDQQRGVVLSLLYLPKGVPPQVVVGIIQALQNATGAEGAWLTQFRTTAAPDERQFFDATVTSAANQVVQMRDSVITAVQLGQQTNTDPEAWRAITQAKLDKMRDVEHRIATNLATASDSIASSAARQAWVGGIGVTLVLILSIAISLFVASPMIRQLRRLRGTALEVANTRLPGVVERLHRGEAVDVAAESFPNEYLSRDEIGQLADAFSTVHRVAVATAVEQAAMRKSIGDTFLNLARRSQALIHRQLKIIDGLERKETDPDELDELFRLDHLATRMRRHAEDLIVLSGSKPARGWRRPVPAKDVIRGAVAEVEDYTRVKVLPVHAGAISGHAVGDVIHMLAELIENATSFSPPHTPVHVSGHEVSNGCAIEIEDRGLGMTDDELTAINERLANPPPFDLKTSERLGLFVVGRLAERHSIKVKLRPSPYGGTMAIVLVPSTLLRDEEVTARSASVGVGADTPQPAAAAVTSDGEPRELTAVGASTGAPGNGTQADGSDAYLVESSFDRPGDWSADRHTTTPYQRAVARFTGSGPDEPDNRDDSPLMDDLPVFATVRSSWFVSDRDRSGVGVEQPWSPSMPGPAGGTAALGPPTNGAGEGLGGDRAGTSSLPPHRGPVVGSYQLDSPSEPPGRQPPPVYQTTEVGLPKRTRRSHLAPELRRNTGDASGSAVVAGPRSPDEIRSMMTSFQTNFGRGLEDGRGPTDDDEPGKVT